MKRLHYISGITITVFIALHMLNHLFSLLGAETHIAFMNQARIIYRNPIVETVLLASVVIQIVSGLRLFVLKRKHIHNRYEKLQIWSGIYLAVFFLIHVSAVLMGRFILDLDTNFYFGVAGLNTFPFNLFFIPYYSLAIMAFFGHIAAIHHQKMDSEIFGWSVQKQSLAILAIGGILSIMILYGTTNGFNGVEIPLEYHVMIGK